jgi:hypothetical protein
MYLCDYTCDLGLVLKRVRPFWQGINTATGEFIPLEQILLQVSNYIPVDRYDKVSNKSPQCSFPIRPRRLVIEEDLFIYELEYPLPFTELDWSVLEQARLQVEQFPEFINDPNVRLIIRAIR